jgi:hypothetical protein
MQRIENLLRLSACLVLALCLITIGYGQETTAGLQGTVKDSSGAVIANAAVEISGPALIGTKKLNTDAGGNYRFVNLPPGTYTVTTVAQGFRTSRQENINLQVGRFPTLDITMEIGAVAESVEVNAQSLMIDVTQSKVQTNISDNLLMNVPTQSRSFQSVIQFAPGARTEPLQSNNQSNNGNGFQIDGASNSENAYLVEGQETASLQDGHSAVNVPMDFIQEVQVKTSGFEAEYGGALGGVVNVIQKRGSNEYHGSVFLYYRGSPLDAAPNPTNIKDPLTPANANGAKRLDQPIVNYQPIKDKYRVTTPGFTLGGSLIKDRLWFFASTAPEFQTNARTLNMAPASGAPGARQFDWQTNTYYSLARLDYLATQKIRLYGAWSYSYQRGSGIGSAGTTTLPQADDYFGSFNSSSTTNPDNWNHNIGYVAPNTIWNTGADITITPNVVATTRFGYFYQDTQDRGLPVGDRYIYRDTNYPYSTTITPVPADLKALDGTTIPSKYVNATGWANIGANSLTAFDKWKRYSFNQDLAWFFRGAGTHNFKVGYGFSHGTNDVFNSYASSDVYVAFNTPYAPQTTNGIARCQNIIAQNQAMYGNGGGAPDGSACQGLWGTVNLRDLATIGKVGGWNHSLYVQDAWTIGCRLTVNLGVRFDKESLPTYDTSTGFQGIDFGWGQKAAPRFGAAYDIKGDGKFKVYGSFGYFYDIMKYNLPRGSFGGDYWHDCVYALDTPDFYSIIPKRDAQGHYCPIGGGATPAVGSFPANGMRFIENYDYRVPANNPNQAGSLGPTGLVDPNLLPMKQHEMVIGTETQLTRALVFETRYSRKRLDRTIEDAGTITQDGEVYYITNPGQGVNTVVPNCPSCPPNPAASRRYDGVEFRLTKRLADRWTGSFSYTYSRLYGNYSGLTATDISDGGAGRNGANADRAFDEPFMSFDAHGKAIDGPLGTDRPNTFKFYGYYNLKWWKFNTMIGGYQQIYSGTPLSSYISVWGAPVFVEGRGKMVDLTRDPATGNWIAGNIHDARTPMFNQTDLSVSQEFNVSKTSERMKARVSLDCLNCLNNHSPTFIDQNMIRTSGINPAQCGTPGTACTPVMADAAGFDYASIMNKGYDYIGLANSQGRTLNSRYGMPYGWQTRRNLRFQLTFVF